MKVLSKAVLIFGVLGLGFFIFGLFSFLVSGPAEIRFEIEQEIGGTLIVTGTEWMDMQSYGDITTLSYMPSGSEVGYSIGSSDYYGRGFDQQKQILKHGEVYMIAVGNRLDGDKLYASKNLKQWRKFTFSKDSIQSKVQDHKQQYLPRYYPDYINLDQSLESAIWLRRVGEGSDLKAQEIIFTFTLNWGSGEIICEQILKTIDSVEF